MMKYEVTILQSSSDATQGRIAITSAFQEKTGENCMGRSTSPIAILGKYMLLVSSMVLIITTSIPSLHSSPWT